MKWLQSQALTTETFLRHTFLRNSIIYKKPQTPNFINFALLSTFAITFKF